MAKFSELPRNSGKPGSLEEKRKERWEVQKGPGRRGTVTSRDGRKEGVGGKVCHQKAD